MAAATYPSKRESELVVFLVKPAPQGLGQCGYCDRDGATYNRFADAERLLPVFLTAPGQVKVSYRARIGERSSSLVRNAYGKWRKNNPFFRYKLNL